jgi:hypothetical protein
MARWGPGVRPNPAIQRLRQRLGHADGAPVSAWTRPAWWLPYGRRPTRWWRSGRRWSGMRCWGRCFGPTLQLCVSRPACVMATRWACRLDQGGTKPRGAGLVAQAVSYFEDLAATTRRLLGPDHPYTLTARHELAWWRGEAGDPAGAATAFAELLTDRLRVLGPDHHGWTCHHGWTW